MMPGTERRRIFENRYHSRTRIGVPFYTPFCHVGDPKIAGCLPRLPLNETMKTHGFH